MSLQLKNSKDRDNFSKGIARFTKEDPTLKYHYDADNKVKYEKLCCICINILNIYMNLRKL